MGRVVLAPRGRACRHEVAALAILLLGAATVHAHHSVLAYDGATPTTVTGRVVRVLWQNPHVYIALDVAIDRRHTRWVVENEGASALERIGWTRSSLHVGDVVTVTGARARDGSARVRCASVVASARRLVCFASEAIQ
jgi:hypothetical protein